MTATSLAQQIHARCDSLDSDKIDIALILGSGLAGFIDTIENAVVIPYSELNGFPHAGVEGHEPNLVIGQIGGLNVAVLGGRAHYYEQGDAAAMRLPLETLKALGTQTLVLTNSAGSAHNGISAGDFMLINDHLNLTGANPLIGESSNQRFVDMSCAYDAELQSLMKKAANKSKISLQQGVYAWLSGPSFETPAEVRMAHILGADAVGMSTVPEVILARFLGMKVIALSNITNAGAGLSDIELSHQHTQNSAASSADDFKQLITNFLTLL